MQGGTSRRAPAQRAQKHGAECASLPAPSSRQSHPTPLAGAAGHQPARHSGSRSAAPREGGPPHPVRAARPGGPRAHPAHPQPGHEPGGRHQVGPIGAVGLAPGRRPGGTCIAGNSARLAGVPASSGLCLSDVAHHRPLRRAPDRFELLARLCPSATGADIRSVCTEAGMFAIRARRRSVTEDDFLRAVHKVGRGPARCCVTWGWRGAGAGAPAWAGAFCRGRSYQ